ncbi:MAG: TolC family protein [Janthinobacterium lividum]
MRDLIRQFKLILYHFDEKKITFAILIYFATALSLRAQNTRTNDTTQNFTLQQCVDYALQHQPGLQQAIVNVSIARATNAINLAAWLPQVSAAGSFSHYLELPTTYVTTAAGGAPVRQQSGVSNSFAPGVTASQALFSPNLLFIARSAPLYIKEAKQVTDSTKINVVATVSKSFYNLLLTLEQINVLKEDTARLGKNVRDAYHQYVGGIVDETDYEQATITLSNSKVQLKQATENVVPQYATLKQLMGYQPEKQFNVNFDTLKMIQNINMDTTQQLQYEKRIEYQVLNTERSIQNQNINYYRFSFLPSLSAFYNYNLAFYNNSFSNLFSTSYPNSSVGLSISVPIFTGFARLQSVRRAKLQQQQLNLTEVNLKSQIYTEYTTALANYKSDLYNLHELQKNVNLAKRVYFVVDLQYKQGVVAYLNVITAESNLITSEIGYINALFQLLSSKIDLQKAMGNISY